MVNKGQIALAALCGCGAALSLYLTYSYVQRRNKFRAVLQPVSLILFSRSFFFQFTNDGLPFLCKNRHPPLLFPLKKKRAEARMSCTIRGVLTIHIGPQQSNQQSRMPIMHSLSSHAQQKCFTGFKSGIEETIVLHLLIQESTVPISSCPSTCLSSWTAFWLVHTESWV